MDQQTKNDFVDLFGEVLCEKGYDLFGNEKFTFAEIMRFIKQKEMPGVIQNGITFERFKKINFVSNLTLYRFKP